MKQQFSHVIFLSGNEIIFSLNEEHIAVMYKIPNDKAAVYVHFCVYLICILSSIYSKNICINKKYNKVFVTYGS